MTTTTASPARAQRAPTPGTFKLRVRRSRTGLGLFTEEPITKDSCIIEYTGRVLSKEETFTSKSKYLFEINKHKTIDGAARSNTARYINHSCEPNCRISYRAQRVFIYAKRNIAAGEELTYDYESEYFNHFIKPHGCRCSKCQPTGSAHTKAKTGRRTPAR